MAARWKIGDLARRSGVTAKAIRYYEAQGLLPPPRRSPAGYRLYDEEALAHLGFVLRAKALGLSLQEIREVLAVRRHQGSPCQHVLALLEEKVRRLDQRLEGLRALRGELARLKEEAQERLKEAPPEGHICGIIEGLGAPAAGVSAAGAPGEGKGWPD